MKRNERVRDQFNLQASRFANWSVTRNREYMERYFEFCGLTPEDRLLDVACGPGEFTRFCARRISWVVGVDISDHLMEMASEKARLESLENISFHCLDVERIPFEGNQFSFVLCKSAFHHFERPLKVMREMVRLTRLGGRISTQDIVAYPDPYVNAYFERLETLIDQSHQRALGREEFLDLFRKTGLDQDKTLEVQIELAVEEYLNHAFQTHQNHQEARQLIERGLKNEKIAPYLLEREGVLYFRRGVFLTLSRKRSDAIS